MKAIAKETALAVCGGCLYVVLELLWRGRKGVGHDAAHCPHNQLTGGTYHEISLLPGALRDEQLRALTE